MEEEELDESMLDWWSKYFASIETLTEVKPSFDWLYNVNNVAKYDDAVLHKFPKELLAKNFAYIAIMCNVSFKKLKKLVKVEDKIKSSRPKDYRHIIKK